MLVKVHCAAQRHDSEGARENAAADNGENSGDEQQRYYDAAGVALLHGQDADHEQLEHEQRCDDVVEYLRPKLRMQGTHISTDFLPLLPAVPENINPSLH